MLSLQQHIQCSKLPNQASAFLCVVSACFANSLTDLQECLLQGTGIPLARCVPDHGETQEGW
jgi:hypothetical protein